MPLAACFAKAFIAVVRAVLGGRVDAARTIAAYEFTLLASFASSIGQRGAGLPRRLGAGALRVSAQAALRCAGRPAVRLADRRGGLVYSSLYVENGWLGQFLVPLGIHGAYSRLAVVLVLTFLGIPFVVRTLQPVLESLDADTEEAALPAGRHALADVLARDPADAAAGADHRLRLVAGPRAGRVRLGGLRLRQHAVSRPRSRRC